MSQKDGNFRKRDPTRAKIEAIARQREQRRRSAEQYKRERAQEQARNEKRGAPGDVDFQRMIQRFRAKNKDGAARRSAPGEDRICIVARKRPINRKEVARKDYDAVTMLNPRAIVHACKLKVDGITKYLENLTFAFDHTFDEDSSNDDVYKYTAMPLVAFAFQRGRGTCFAYGQTGSGKTYTMTGIQELVARDTYRLLDSEKYRSRELEVFASMYEIYGGRCTDLLNGRQRVTIREDGHGKIQTVGLQEVRVESREHLLQLVHQGNACRTTHSTAMNEQSSRSHALFDVTIREPTGRLYGKISLVDLAGSERASDRQSHNRQRRRESAEINKSLLALKECIRALDSGGGHVPFRASKLTMVLKDSFTSRNSRVVMISAVSPCSSASDHTQNTLRYADRIKQKPTSAAGGGGGAGKAYERMGGPAAVEIMQMDDQPAAERPAPSNPNLHPSGPNPARRVRVRGSAAGASPSAAAAGGGNGGRGRDWDQSPDDAGKEEEDSDDEATPAGVPTTRGRRSPIPAPPEDDDTGPSAGSGRQDLRQLHETLQREGEAGGADGDRWLAIHEVMDRIVEEEEGLLTAHMESIQRNAEMLTEEGQLLSKVQGRDVVDYDIDGYAKRLDQILRRRLRATQSLLERLTSFRQNLALEDELAQREGGDQ